MRCTSISDFSQTATQYAKAHFEAAGRRSDQWTVSIDHDRLLSMRRNAKDGSLLLTAWQQVVNNDSDIARSRSEALMRRTFDTRLGAGLIGGISPASGFGLSLPLYAATDAPALQTAAEYLLRELNSLGHMDATSAMPAIAGDARATLGNADQAERCFARLASACHAPSPFLHQRSFDLLFGDLPGRLMLHPSNRLLLVDFFLHDVGSLQGSQRRVLHKSALEISQATLSGNAFAVGMDNRELVTSTSRVALERLDDDMWPRWLRCQVEQACDMRDLIKLLARVGAQTLSGFNKESRAGACGAFA